MRAVHIVEEKDGRAQTLGPRQRAKAIASFRHGDAQVLCCGIPSIRLGHNLDTAAVVIVDGLVFSYEMFDQFIARVHRLTSKRPVTVYVPLVQGSLDEKKWELLSQKAQAADLALDGQLVPQREEPVSLEKVLRDLQRAGIRPTGAEIDEARSAEGVARFAGGGPRRAVHPAAADAAHRCRSRAASSWSCSRPDYLELTRPRRWAKRQPSPVRIVNSGWSRPPFDEGPIA